LNQHGTSAAKAQEIRARETLVWEVDFSDCYWGIAMFAILIRRLVWWLLALLLLPSSGWAWTQGLQEAVNAVAAGTATPTQQMTVFVNNTEVNLMAQKGMVNLDAYKTVQQQFNDLNQKFVKQAFDGSGFDPHASELKLNPGTDTDINVKPSSGANTKIKLEDITKAEDKYQKAIKEYFQNQPGIDKSKVPTSHVDTNTDFMPHPEHVDPGEFKKIANHINDNHGTMYTDPKAASAQAKLGDKAAKLTVEEAGAFSKEVKELANAKIAAADKARKDAAAIRASNPGEASKLEAMASNYEYQAAKYHARLTDVNNQLRGQYGLTNKAGAMDDVSRAIANIGRNPYSSAEVNMVRSLHAKALQNSADNMIGSMLEIAKKNPGSLPQIRQIIAAESKALSAAGAAKAATRLQDAVQQIEAAAKWAAFKEAAKDLSGFNATTKFSAVMTAGGAILIGYQGVQIALTEVKADDTFLDFLKNVYIHAGWEGTGLGPAFEGAQKEEIDKYMKEIMAGRDPSMFKHITFTILKTGVYMGQEAIIGILTLPSTIWEAFTQEKEMEAYAAMQNELAKVMRQMILDRRAFDDLMTRMRKLGLHDEDAKFFLDCMCRSCGGSLGGLYNPSFKGEYGHGPCQCNGPLTIWKTPLPVGDKKVEYACFNSVTKMRYDQAQDIFDKWHQQALKENAQSVAPALAEIKQEIVKGNLENDEELVRRLADQFAAIQPLLLPDDADWVKAMIGPHLVNHAYKQAEKGNLPRAVENMDKAIDKVGIRGAQNEANSKQQREQYKAWDPVWKQAKEKRLAPIDAMLGKRQIDQARGHLEVLEYQMIKDPTRPLPPAIKDPDFLRLKTRLDELQKAYNEALATTMKTSSDLQKAKDMRAAIPVLERMLNDWEHRAETAEGFRRQIAYDREQVAKADDLRKRGQDAEGQGNLPLAIEQYTASLDIQRDEGLQAHVARLKGTQAEQQARKVQARQLRDQAQALQQQGRIAEAIAGYKQSLAIWPDPELQTFVTQLEKGLADQQARKAQAKQLRDQAQAQQQQGRIAEAIGGYKQSLVLWPDPELQAFVTQLEKGLADQQARKAQARQLRDQAQALQQQGRIAEAIAGYRQSLGLWPDPELEDFIRKLEAGMAQTKPSPVPAPATQAPVPAAVVPAVNPVGVWRHEPSASWTIRRLPNGQYFAEETGLGYASGPGVWTPSGSFRIDYVTRDGAIKGIYEVIFDPAGHQASGTVRELNGPQRSGRTNWTRIAGTEPTSAPVAPVATAPAPAVQTIGNIAGVSNGPTKPSTFTLDEPRVLTLLQTYHWNNAGGAAPGTIGLRDAEGRTYGPWRADGTPGQGGVPNAYWNTRPGVTLAPGTYTVIDSDPSTWAQNAGTGGAGHIRVETGSVSATGSAPPAPRPAAPVAVTSAQPASQPPVPSTSQTGVVANFPVVGRWKTETIEAGKIVDVSETIFNTDGSYTMDVSPDTLAGTAVCTIRGQYSVAGAALNLRPQGSQCRFKDGTTRSEPIERYDTVKGPVSGDARTFTFRPEGMQTTVRYTRTEGAVSTAVPAAPSVQGSAGKTGSPSASASTLSAELRNASREAVHIVVEGDRYDPANRLSPGEKRVLLVTPKADGSVTFQAGRNGQTIATKIWRGVAGDKSRVPVVVFDEANPFEKLVITTGLR
jgi:hypothetical protein